MAKKLILDSPLPLQTCLQRLAQEADARERTWLSLSGCKGERNVIYELNGTVFQLQKRCYWRNDFAPVFFGWFTPVGGGTRIQGQFNSAVWVRIFMWIWLGLVAVGGLPVFFYTLLPLISQHRRPAGGEWVGLLVPPGLLIWGFVLPTLGRLLGKPKEAFLRHFLENTFSGNLRRQELSEAFSSGPECA